MNNFKLIVVLLSLSVAGNIYSMGVSAQETANLTIGMVHQALSNWSYNNTNTTGVNGTLGTKNSPDMKATIAISAVVFLGCAFAKYIHFKKRQPVNKVNG